MPQLQVTEILSRVPYFSGLDEKALTWVAEATLRKQYREGEYVFLEEEPCLGLYIVESGWARAVKISPEGREQVIRFVGPGDAFNEVGVLTGGVNVITVEALESLTLLIVERETLLDLVDKYSSLARALIENLAGRVLYAMNLVTDLSLRSVESRLACYLLKQAGGNNLINRQKWATQAVIASRIGTVPVVVNRAFRMFVEEGLIELGRTEIRILDQDKLLNIADVYSKFELCATAGGQYKEPECWSSGWG